MIKKMELLKNEKFTNYFFYSYYKFQLNIIIFIIEFNRY